jgi:hypothetical protein
MVIYLSVTNKGVETTQKPLQHEKNNNVVHFILECFGPKYNF